MTTVGNSGANNPQFNTIQETAATVAIGRTQPLNPQTPQLAQSAQVAQVAQLSPQDQIRQTAGVTGKAAPVDLVGSTPQANQIRDLLARKDFDAITDLVNRLGERGLGKLDLSLDEIKTIAEGMGQGSWNAGLPVFASFSTEDRQAVQTLLMHSLLHINQKVGSLNQTVGPEAVISLLRSSESRDLEGLSMSNRHMMMAMLDPGNSIWGSIKGASGEVARRFIGNDTQADELKSKLLLATKNESQVRELLDTLNQFNRDDVVFQYVKDMPPAQLNKLSEGFKTYLLKELVDSKINVAGFELDLNKIANLDEMLKMVSPEHAQVARSLYLALKPETRQSAEVQEIVKSSDVMMKQLQDLEREIKTDADGGKLSADKLNTYRERLTSFKAQTAHDPALQQKTAELENLLNQLQQGLTQADQTRQLGLTAVSQATQALTGVQQQAKTLQDQVKSLSSNVGALELKITTTENNLKNKLTQLSALAQNAGALGEEYSQIIGQIQPLIDDGKPLPGKLPQLDQLMTKLQQAESRLSNLSPELASLKTQFGELRSQIQQQRQELTQATTQFNQQRRTLETKTTRLETLLGNYQTQISQLERKQSEASTKLAGFTELPDAQRQTIQKELKTAADAIQSHQASYAELDKTLKETLVPGARAAVAVAAEVNSQVETVQSRFAQAEVLVASATEMISAAETQIQEVESALDATKRQARELVVKLGSTLDSMSSNDLKAAKGQISDMAKALRAQNNGDQKAIEAELNQLNEINTLIDKTQADLKAAKDIRDNLGKALNGARNTNRSTSQVLESALRDVQAASAAVTDARQSVDLVEGELARLGDDVKGYEQEILRYTEALNALGAGNETSKADFKKALPTQPGQKPGSIQTIQAESQKMLQTFASNESSRDELRAKIKDLRAKMESKQLEMQHQRGQLETANQSLTSKLKGLKESQTKLQPLIESLGSAEITMANTIAENSELIAKWAGQKPSNKAVVAALDRAKQENINLQTQQKKVGPLLEQARLELANIDSQIRDLEAASAQVSEQILDVDVTLNQKLAGAVSQLDKTQNEIRDLDARKAALKSELQTLLGQLDSGNGMSSEAVFSQLKTFLDRSQDYETMQLINEIGSRVGEARGAVRSADQIVSQANLAVSSAKENLSSSQAEVARINADIHALEIETGQMEAETRDAQTGLLDVQRQLLEQRRQLGVVNPQYQNLLERYSQILEAGRPMTAAEADELKGIESQLTGMESDLARVSDQLSSRITQMNMLKSRVNTRIDELSQKTRRLEELRAKLVTSQAQLTTAKQTVGTAREGLVKKRDELKRLRDELASKPRIQGLAEVKAVLSNLDSAIAELDAGIGRADDSLKGIDETLEQTSELITQIDKGLEAARNLKGRLEMIQGKLADMLIQAAGLKADLGDLLALLGKLKLEFKDLERNLKEFVQAPPADSGPSEQPGYSAPTSPQAQSNGSGTQHLSEQRTEQRRLSFSQRLSDQMTNLWGQRQRQAESRHEQEHQTRRAAMIQDLEQRLALSRQFQTELSAQAAERQGLEDITAHKVQMALMGLDDSSSLNVV